MVQFNKDSFTINVEGCKQNCLDSVNTLVYCLSTMPPESLNEYERFLLSNIIKGLLPSAEQITGKDK